MEAYLFMLIFAGVLFLVSASLYFSRDPRKSVWMGSAPKKTKADAVKAARQTAIGVALVAVVITVGSVIGLVREDLGWWVILSGVIAAVLLAIRISRQEDEPEEEEAPKEEDGRV